MNNTGAISGSQQQLVRGLRSRPRGIRRVGDPVPLMVAKGRLQEWASHRGCGPWAASILAGVIWPDGQFRNAQGAGAAASRVLKRLGYRWTCLYKPVQKWGWMLEEQRNALPLSRGDGSKPHEK